MDFNASHTPHRIESNSCLTELTLGQLSESLHRTISSLSNRIDDKFEILLRRTSSWDNFIPQQSSSLRSDSGRIRTPKIPSREEGGTPKVHPQNILRTPNLSPHDVFSSVPEAEIVAFVSEHSSVNNSEPSSANISRPDNSYRPIPTKTRVSASSNESRLAFSRAKVPDSALASDSQPYVELGMDNFDHKMPTDSFHLGSPLGKGEELEDATDAVAPMASMSSEPFQLELSKRANGWDKTVWLTLNDPSFSIFARMYHYLMPMINIMSVVPALMQTMVYPSRVVEPDTPLLTSIIGIEYCFEILCLTDLLLRFWATPRRKYFAVDLYNVVDILAVASLPVRVDFRSRPLDNDISLNVEEFILFCIVPILRLLACLRHSELLLLLLGAFREASRALPVLLYLLVVFTLILSSLVYVAEDRSNIQSVPHAIWLVMVTWSTVGYGDVVPQTSAGTMVIGLTIFAGVLYMAVPIGLISKIFGDMWSQRDRILFLKRLKKSLVLRNVLPQDVARLFNDFDIDSSGELDLIEWEEMMVALQVHSRLSKDRNCGFHYFANLDEVHVTAKRFVHVLWPDVYHEVFGLKRRSLVHNRLRQSLTASAPSKQPSNPQMPKLESKASNVSLVDTSNAASNSEILGNTSPKSSTSRKRPAVELRLQAANSTVTKSSTASSFNPGTVNC